MNERIPYPFNYFDPDFPAHAHAQCTECGEWKDLDDFNSDTLEEVDFYGASFIEGVCKDCAECQ
jgi:Fe2+ or Zn2+ uptake regulation protein